LDVAVDVLTEIRRAKSDAQRSMRTEVERVLVRDTAARLAALEEARDDVIAAGRVQALGEALALLTGDPSWKEQANETLHSYLSAEPGDE
jgi:hypothetical protein